MPEGISEGAARVLRAERGFFDEGGIIIECHASEVDALDAELEALWKPVWEALEAYDASMRKETHGHWAASRRDQQRGYAGYIEQGRAIYDICDEYLPEEGLPDGGYQLFIARDGEGRLIGAASCASWRDVFEYTQPDKSEDPDFDPKWYYDGKAFFLTNLGTTSNGLNGGTPAVGIRGAGSALHAAVVRRAVELGYERVVFNPPLRESARQFHRRNGCIESTGGWEDIWEVPTAVCGEIASVATPQPVLQSPAFGNSLTSKVARTLPERVLD